MILYSTFVFVLASLEFSLPTLLCYRHYLVRGKKIGQIGFLASSIISVFVQYYCSFPSSPVLFEIIQSLDLFHLLGTIITLRIFFRLYSNLESPGIVQETPGTLTTTFLQIATLSLLNPIKILAPGAYDTMLQKFFCTDCVNELHIPSFIVFIALVSCNFLFHNSVAWILQKMVHFHRRRTSQSFQTIIFSWSQRIELVGICVGILVVISSSWHFFFHYPLEILPTRFLLGHEKITLCESDMNVARGLSIDPEIDPECLARIDKEPAFGNRQFPQPEIETGIVNRDLYYVPTINKYSPSEKFRAKRKQIWDSSSLKNFNDQFDNYPWNEMESFFMSKLRNNATPKEIKKIMSSDLEFYEKFLVDKKRYDNDPSEDWSTLKNRMEKLDKSLSELANKSPQDELDQSYYRQFHPLFTVFTEVLEFQNKYKGTSDFDLEEFNREVIKAWPKLHLWELGTEM